MEDFKNKLKEQTKNLILDNYGSFIKNIWDGIKYIAFIFLVIVVFKHLLKFVLELAIQNNIKITGNEYVELMKNFGTVVVWIILIGILSRPAVKLANKIKKLSRDGVQFGDEEQNTSKVAPKKEVQHDSVEDIINSDDENSLDEAREEHIYERRIENSENTTNYLKCKNIKENMKPLTALITRELYINSKENITKEIVFEYICNIKNRRGKKLEEQNKQIAKNIVEFLKKNDIIESDDMEDDKYYFTYFGNLFMNYFQSGII